MFFRDVPGNFGLQKRHEGPLPVPGSETEQNPNLASDATLERAPEREPVPPPDLTAVSDHEPKPPDEPKSEAKRKPIELEIPLKTVTIQMTATFNHALEVELEERVKDALQAAWDTEDMVRVAEILGPHIKGSLKLTDADEIRIHDVLS